MNYMPSTKEHLIATLRVLTILAIVAFLSFSLTSCESKSGHLTTKQAEKVVIIDSRPQSMYYSDYKQSWITEYKVNRIEKGVVQFTTAKSGFEKGDTILVTF